MKLRVKSPPTKLPLFEAVAKITVHDKRNNIGTRVNNDRGVVESTGCKDLLVGGPAALRTAIVESDFEAVIRSGTNGKPLAARVEIVQKSLTAGSRSESEEEIE